MDFESLKNLGLNFDENTVEAFLKYIELFKNYNAHTNLISKNDEKYLFEKHIYDSLAFNLFCKKYKIPKNIMDIGTGGGFPSLPLALAFKKTKVYAVDSTEKKINFIKEVKDILKLKNISAEAIRIENLPVLIKESFEAVTSRALGSLRIILEYAIPYLKVGGYFVAYKSADSENELMQAKNALKILNTKLVDTIEYKLPLEEHFDRKLLIFQKTEKTSKDYPRSYNIIKRSPL